MTLTATTDTAAPRTGARRIFAAVESHARLAPAAIAVSAPDGELTFAELPAHVHRLVRVLTAAGVGPGTSVGLCLGRSWRTVPALLAVWWVGASAVPVDDKHPADRLAYQLDDAGIEVLLGDRLPAGAAPEGAATIDPDGDATVALPRPAGRADDCAYLIYTSGTTGRPKGVEVSYRALGTFLGAIQTLGLTRGGLGFNPLSPAFDGWLWCTLLYLLHGQGVALVDLARGDGGVDLAASIEAVAPRTVCLSPSLLSACPDDLPSVDVLVVAGEPCPPGLVRRFAGRRLLNVYGPTEATIAATWADSASGDDVTTIGRAAPGYATYVLDSERRPVPPGEDGELYIGGPAVARGYRNRPGLTAARFVPDPFTADGARMYRTGDLVREDVGGQLRFLGRIDDQVKVRAFRVELGEVERTAGAVDGVRAAAAFLVSSGDALGLALTVTPGTDPATCVEKVRATCGERLPDFMVPVAVEVLPALPTTPTGKVDRAALSTMVATVRPATGRPPSTEREKQVCEVWSSLLPHEVSDVDGDFFDMGGHSLLAARAVVALRRATGLRLSMADLLANPTAGGLARHIDELVAKADAR